MMYKNFVCFIIKVYTQKLYCEICLITRGASMGKYFKNGMDKAEMISVSRKRIGKRLSDLRKKNGDKQKDVAEVINVSKGQISRIEQGEADIKASAISLLADRYDVLAEAFFNDIVLAHPYTMLKLIKAAGYEEYSEPLMRFTDFHTDRVIEKGKENELLTLFMMALDCCYNYSDPLNEMIRKINQAKQRDMMPYYTEKAEVWVRENG